MDRVIGIDAGLNGALAFLSEDGLLVERMPVISIGKKKRIDLNALEGIMLLWQPSIAIIEEAQVMPNQGSVSGFTIGFNYSSLITALYMMRIPTEEVRPTAWKKALRVSANKDDCRYRAQQLFPNNASDFSKKSDDGLAEAALLTYYYKTRGN